MNLNEKCLLFFLLNPEELQDLSEIFVKNIEDIEKNAKLINN